MCIECATELFCMLIALTQLTMSKYIYCKPRQRVEQKKIIDCVQTPENLLYGQKTHQQNKIKT